MRANRFVCDVLARVSWLARSRARPAWSAGSGFSRIWRSTRASGRSGRAPRAAAPPTAEAVRRHLDLAAAVAPQKPHRARVPTLAGVPDRRQRAEPLAGAVAHRAAVGPPGRGPALGLALGPDAAARPGLGVVPRNPAADQLNRVPAVADELPHGVVTDPL